VNLVGFIIRIGWYLFLNTNTHHFFSAFATHVCHCYDLCLISDVHFLQNVGAMKPRHCLFFFLCGSAIKQLFFFGDFNWYDHT